MFELTTNTTQPDEAIVLDEDDRDYFAAGFHDVPRRHAETKAQRELAAIYT